MSSTPPAPRLELRGICKSYADVRAVDDVSLAVDPGEIHALLGENGAGKSTLVKVIYGLVQADAGAIAWEGTAVDVAGPAQARHLGIGVVFQHFSLFESLTVAENVGLALPGRLELRALTRRLEDLSHRYRLPLDPSRRVGSLSVGERQRVEVLRALLQSPRLLILDEPTSVLTPQAVTGLFATLRQLAAEGCSILYISHKLEEIRALCDRATVLRSGRVTGRVHPGEESAAALARLMIGHEAPAVRERSGDGDGHAARLEVERLSRPPADPFGCALHEVSLSLREGEVLGIAGVSGNGQRELLETLSGEAPLEPAEAARVRLDGHPVGDLPAGARRARGLAFVPEERLGRGTVPALGLEENALLTAHRRGMVRHGMVIGRAMRAFASRCIERFDVRCPGPETPAGRLSGGNLQKFLVGREILQDPAVLLAAQPTWGLDVGAAGAIRQALIDLAERGTAVLVVSEDLDELLEICDHIAVLADGRLSSPIRPVDTSAEALGLLMGGVAGPGWTVSNAG